MTIKILNFIPIDIFLIYLQSKIETTFYVSA